MDCEKTEPTECPDPEFMRAVYFFDCTEPLDFEILTIDDIRLVISLEY